MSIHDAIPNARLSNNFLVSEFICKCGECDGGRMDPKFINKLQYLRDALREPIHISSGYRCLAHNRAIGGSPRSTHMRGIAADITCESSIQRFRLIHLAMSLGFRGLGIGRNFVHVDNRQSPHKVLFHYYASGKSRR